VISHGFTSEEGRFDDTWAFDLANNSWRDISPTSTRQLRRCLHHAVYVPLSDEMLLDGGCSGRFGPCAEGDLWSFDLANNRWAEITSNPRPARRQRYGMVFDDNRKKLVHFGGLGGPPFNDTWEYDPAPKAWTQVTARRRYSSSSVSGGGRVCIRFTNSILLRWPDNGFLE